MQDAVLRYWRNPPQSFEEVQSVTDSNRHLTDVYPVFPDCAEQLGSNFAAT
jgi:hypothetical protein